MAFEPFMQILRGMQGRRSGTGLGQLQNPQQMAFLRGLQQEMDQQDAMYTPLEKLVAVVFDIETTGFYPEKGDGILSIGAIKMRGTELLESETFYSLAYHDQEIPEAIVQLTGITNEQIKEARPLADVLVDFFQFVQDSTLVAHHANHERNLQHASTKLFRTPLSMDCRYVIYL